MNQFSNALEKPLTFFIPFLILMIALLPACAALGDTEPDRGATTVKQDVFGDHFTTVEYLPQNWAPADSLWFFIRSRRDRT